MRSSVIAVALVGVALLSSCSSLTIEELDARLGPAPTGKEMQEGARGSISGHLYDPVSALYYFEDPFRVYKGHVPANLAEGSKVGWTIPFWVNAKNRFGGYVGRKKYFYMRGTEWSGYYQAHLVTGFRKIQLESGFTPSAEPPPNEAESTLGELVDSLEPGMSPEAVLDLLGPPVNDTQAGQVRVLTYSWKDGPTQRVVALSFVSGELQPLQ